MRIDVIKVERQRAWAPRVTETTRPFWEALAAGIFTTTRCEDCFRYTFPPKPVCPHCWSNSLRWVELSGRGTLYSRTVIHAPPKVFAHEGPMHVGIVDLAEGIRIACAMAEKSPLPLDSPVEMLALLYDDGPLFAARSAHFPGPALTL
jgi:uncharacterized OB-fold protein